MSKSITVFFGLALLCTSAVAQLYTPVIINGEAFFRTELATDQGLVISEITVANFEEVGGRLYNRVFFKRGLEPDLLIGWLREEPENSKLYFREITAQNDQLVYDLTLEAGQSVTLDARWCDDLSGNTATVIRETTGPNGRELVFDRMVGAGDICDTLRFIEGVGPSAGVIFPYFQDALLANGAAMRICHASREGVFYYPANSNTDFCGFTDTEEQALEAPSAFLFPNPFREFLHVGSGADLAAVAVYSASGQLLGRFAGRDLGTPFSTSDWPAGFYLAVFTHVDGRRGVQKLVRK